MKLKLIVILSLISFLCFAQKRIGFGFEYSNTFAIKNGGSMRASIISQKIVKNFGFNLNLKSPTITNHKGEHTDPTANNRIIVVPYTTTYSLLIGGNYYFKKVIFNLNVGYSKTQETKLDYFVQSNYYYHFPSGPYDFNIGKYVSPIKKNIFCFETSIGYNIIETPKFALNTAIGYNNNYGVVFNLNFLFSKQH